MANQVIAEAIFNTAGAVSSANNYTNAILRAVAAQNTLSAAIQQTQGMWGNQSATVAAASAAQTNSIRAITQAYNQMAAAATAAGAAQRGAGNGPRPPSGAGGGGGGGGGTSNRALFGGLYVAHEIMRAVEGSIHLSDRWVEVNGKIKIAVGSMGDFKKTQDDLFKVAQDMHVAYEDVGKLFSRISFAGRDVGITSQQIVSMTSALTAAGRASGQMASETRSMLTQLPQMLATGKAGSDEWRSLKENAPVVIEAIAKNLKKANGEFGVTRQELERLQREGKLFTDDWGNALIRAQFDLKDQAAKVPVTFEQAMTNMKSSWGKAVGEMAEKTGFTDRMVKAIEKISQTMTGDTGMALLAATLDKIAGTFTAIANGLERIAGFIERIVKLRAQIEGVIGSPTIGVDDLNNPAAVQAALEKKYGKIGGRSGSFASGNFSGNVGSFASSALAMQMGPWATSADKIGYIGATPRPPDKEAETATKRVQEMILAKKEQIELERVKATFDEDAIATATANLQIERALTAVMKEKVSPELLEKFKSLSQEEAKMAERNRNAAKDAKYVERVKQIGEEIELQKAEQTGNEKIIDQARSRLMVEKLITDGLVKRNSALALQIEASERQLVIEQRRTRQIGEWKSLYEDMGNTLVNSLIAAGKEGKSFTSGLRDSAKAFAEMAMRALVFKPIIDSISQSLGGSTQGAAGAGTGFLVAGLRAGLSAVLGGGDVGLGSWAPVASAKGNVFSGGSLMAFANGGIVGSPTMFPMSGGGRGLMGEAGPEAIMPLTRGPGGKLGVAASGAGGSAIHINFAPVVHGDLGEDTRMRLMSDFRQLLNSETPSIVRSSVNAVRSENQANPNFLRR